MGINGFEGVGPEWLLSQWESPYLHFFGEMLDFEGGEREADLLMHAL